MILRLQRHDDAMIQQGKDQTGKKIKQREDQAATRIRRVTCTRRALDQCGQAAFLDFATWLAIASISAGDRQS
jgi:hypothetical protein